MQRPVLPDKRLVTRENPAAMGFIKSGQRTKFRQRSVSPLWQGLHGVLPILRHQSGQFCFDLRRFQRSQTRKDRQIPFCRLGEHHASLSMGSRLGVGGDAIAELIHQVVRQAVRPLLGQGVKGFRIPFQGVFAVLLLQCPKEPGQRRQRRQFQQVTIDGDAG